MTRSRKKNSGMRAPLRPAVPAKPAGMRPGRNATINDIARLASVSKKTVSRVINQSPLVQEETRARIQAVIDKFGYVPDPQARGLAFRKSFRTLAADQEISDSADQAKCETRSELSGIIAQQKMELF